MIINKERLVNIFKGLVTIDSESKNEGEIQSHLKGVFEGLGVMVSEDYSKATSGYETSNLYCRFEGNKAIAPIFFSAHMDTVVPGKGVKPEIREGNIYSDGTTVLGADDKAGIAIMIEMVQCLKENDIDHGLIEFVLTVGEETGMVGAKSFDYSRLEATYGFTLDTSGPVGGIIIASPTQYGLAIEIKGIPAHAGVEPEKGVSAIAVAVEAMSAMALGRIDEETTANIGIINGGMATNIVMEDLKIKAEARSISKEKCEKQVKHMVDLFEKSAESMGARVQIEVEKSYNGYLFSDTSKIVKIAKSAIESIGRKPNLIVTGGGSDANIFNEHGKEATNLSVGYEKIHTVSEYQPIEELVKGVALVLEIVKGQDKK